MAPMVVAAMIKTPVPVKARGQLIGGISLACALAGDRPCTTGPIAGVERAAATGVNLIEVGKGMRTGVEVITGLSLFQMTMDW